LGSWEIEDDIISVVTERYYLLGEKVDNDIVLYHYSNPVNEKSKPDVLMKVKE